jgi:hypothetical protein
MSASQSDGFFRRFAICQNSGSVADHLYVAISSANRNSVVANQLPPTGLHHHRYESRAAGEHCRSKVSVGELARSRCAPLLRLRLTNVSVLFA